MNSNGKPPAAREASGIGKEPSREPFVKAQFDPLQAEPSRAARDLDLQVVLDIPITLSVEIGRARFSVKHLLELNEGSVVELDRLAGEPMDVRVNGRLIARGEVVVINEKFGIRLTEVVNPDDRART